MTSKIIRIAILALIVYGVISLFPEVYTWIKTAVDWVLSKGTIGVVVIAVCIIESILGDLF